MEPGIGLASQLQPLRRAAEQHDAEHILERANLLPDRGGCHRQLVGGARKAQMPGSGVDDAERVEWQVSELHGAVAGAWSGTCGMATKKGREAGGESVR